MFKLRPVASKELIEKHLTHEQIFQYYLGVPVTYKGLIRSPIRKDRVKTAGFFVRNGIIFFKDYNGSIKGDCYKVVKELHNCRNYYQAYELICRDFGLIDPSTKTDKAKNQKTIYPARIEKPKATIEIKKRKMNSADLHYWGKYYIGLERLKKYKVFAIEKLYINNDLLYRHSPDNPGYAYYFGSHNGRKRMKVYFPKTKQFYCNTSAIGGIKQLPENGEILIWTKSLKDVICLDMFGIPAVTPQFEGQMPTKALLDRLYKRFPLIISNMDFDRTGDREAGRIYDRAGIRFSANLRKEFGIPAVCIQGYKSKDFSDLLANFGYQKTLEIIRNNQQRIFESIQSQIKKYGNKTN